MTQYDPHSTISGSMSGSGLPGEPKDSNSFKDRATQAISDGSDAAQRTASKAGEAAQGYMEEASKTAAHTYDTSMRSLQNYVNDHPMESACIALAIGALGGFFIGSMAGGGIAAASSERSRGTSRRSTSAASSRNYNYPG